MDLFGISNAINAASNAVESVFGSKEERDKANLALETLKQQPQLAQLLINQIEAQSPNWFVAGWRPAAGWVCVTGMFYHFLIAPILQGILSIWSITMPVIPIQDLLVLLGQMLGLGYLRTREKESNVARS